MVPALLSGRGFDALLKLEQSLRSGGTPRVKWVFCCPGECKVPGLPNKTPQLAATYRSGHRVTTSSIVCTITDFSDTNLLPFPYPIPF